jgi:NAD(P)-dependent dehydrogenase (short-subunit alcohol dehydrogenase family)
MDLLVLGGNPSLLYPTTKGAIIQMTRAMAAHHGKENIRVNCVCPGMVYTPMTMGRGMTPEMREARVNQNLMKKEGTGWDVGNGKFCDSYQSVKAFSNVRTSYSFPVK